MFLSSGSKLLYTGIFRLAICPMRRRLLYKIISGLESATCALCSRIVLMLALLMAALQITICFLFSKTTQDKPSAEEIRNSAYSRIHGPYGIRRYTKLRNSYNVKMHGDDDTKILPFQSKMWISTDDLDVVHGYFSIARVLPRPMTILRFCTFLICLLIIISNVKV